MAVSRILVLQNELNEKFWQTSHKDANFLIAFDGANENKMKSSEFLNDKRSGEFHLNFSIVNGQIDKSSKEICVQTNQHAFTHQRGSFTNIFLTPKKYFHKNAGVDSEMATGRWMNQGAIRKIILQTHLRVTEKKLFFRETLVKIMEKHGRQTRSD